MFTLKTVLCRKVLGLAVAAAVFGGTTAANAQSISGTVRNAYGQPLAGASIAVYRNVTSGDPIIPGRAVAGGQQYVTTVYTDANGHYSVALPQGGTYSLRENWGAGSTVVHSQGCTPGHYYTMDFIDR
ncbi:MAG TPA: carboxypeptidase-like regulatory domain-containing protein [Bacteroidota bacterium]|nr:carboxypeptidase-like regulatory domain-containing protein [Bacteroidota bacterium]